MITKKMLEDAFTAGYNYKTNISKKHPHPDRETYIASKVSETHDLVDDGQEGKVVEEAVKFAEWLNDNRWFHFEKGKWSYTFEHGTAMSKKSYEKNYVKTSQELYKIFNDNNK